jgi:thioredoxin reductase
MMHALNRALNHALNHASTNPIADVIVVGGSFAGHAAAIQLARARKAVLLVDAQQHRNRFAAAAHGFLGHDGRAPAAIMRDAEHQLLAYPTAAIAHATVTSVRREDAFFTLTLDDGSTRHARRLVLATGVRDTLPAIDGMAERWGRTVLHCPYCHGYEVAGQLLGIIANHPMSAHQASLIPDWGPATYFTQGTFEPDADALALLIRRGVAIERTPVVALLGSAPALDAVRLADGRTIALHAVFTAPRTSMASPLAEQLGCTLADGPTGPYIQVDAMGSTSAADVYAAGDATTPMHNATIAAASGVLAGVAAHQSLMRL